MSLLELVLSILSGVLLATTVVYRRKYIKTEKLAKRVLELSDKTTESAEILKAGYELMKQKYESMKEEHDKIFSNLAEDPMCLAKADKAYKDVTDALLLDKSLDRGIANTAICANLVYDSTRVNNYNTETKEITISMFDDMENEQIDFMFDYLNDKYGIDLDVSDIRTRTMLTVLHELGHYVDLANKEQAEIDKDNELYESVYSMEDGPESWKAYREVPTEAFADKFAVEFMIKHFPELV